MITNEQAEKAIKEMKKQLVVKGLKVPVKRTNFYHKQLKRIKRVYEPNNLQKILSEGEFKIILLSPQFKINQLNINQQQLLKQCSIVDSHVILTFENLSNQSIFDAFQKPQQNIPYPNSFQTAGHLAHFNLTPEQNQYRYVIGELTLLKCPNIKTAVNKTQKLHNVYRTPTLEHMAGQKNYLVKMKQVGVNFEFDFQKVYWCSRLQKQRDRMLQKIKPNEFLADIFCGVGPLSVRAAKKGAFVIANDLNPFCYEYLQKNCSLNFVEDKVICWNMCAREAMKKIYKEKQLLPEHMKEPDHIYMNLPVDAIEFLDVFTNYSESLKTNKMPLVHVNCFVVADSDEKSLQLLEQRVSKILPGFKKEDVVDLHHIKNVTIIMRMYCMSFQLKPKYDQQQKEDNEKEIEDIVEKKIKTK